LFTPFIRELAENPQAIRGIGYVSVLAVGGTAIALILFNRLIKIASPVFASSVTYLIPVIALIWGVEDGENFSPEFIFWIFLVLTGIILVNKTKPLKAIPEKIH
jgi:drug/metabolite transporter (DMT)-like permease